jgi:hypothetical protein
MKTVFLCIFVILTFTSTSFGQDCSISNLTAIEAICNEGEVTYTISLNFDYTISTSTSFVVLGTGNAYLGTFLYTNLPVTLSNFPATTDSFALVKVQDAESVSCFEELAFLAPICNTVPCSITNVAATEVTCNEDGLSYSLILDFEYANADQLEFDLFDLDGDLLGSFLYADLPILLINIPITNVNGSSTILVQNGDNPDCFGIVEFALPACPIATCSISNLTATDVVCNGDLQTYTMLLDFDYSNTNQDSFYVAGINQTFLGSFAYADLPVLLTNVPVSVFNTLTIWVTNQENSACIGEIEITAPGCYSGCPIMGYNWTYLNSPDPCCYLLVVDQLPLNYPYEAFAIIVQGVATDTFMASELPFNFYLEIAVTCDALTMAILPIGLPDCEYIFFEGVFCIGTKDDQLSSIRLKGSANMVQLEGVLQVKTTWYDMLGRIVEPKILTSTSWQFDDMPAGIYVLHVQDNFGNSSALQWQYNRQ